MESLLFSFNVLLPLIIEIAIGFILKLMGIIDSHTSKAVNKMVFKLFLPVMLFNNLYTSDIADIFNPGFIMYIVCAVLLLTLTLCILVPIFEKDTSKRGVLIQGMFRSNFAIFGIPLSISIAGDAVIPLASVCVSVVVIVFNVLAVIILEVFNKNNPNIKSIFKTILTNPLIVSCILGILAMAAGIKFPVSIEKTLSGISSVATPLGLIILGTSISFPAIKSNARRLAWAISGKLIVIPAIFISIAVLLGMRGGQIALLLAVFASPTAISSYPMAVEMGHDGELAAQIVMFGTCVCIFTMFLFVFTLKQIGVI